jgi:hypothetical protein
MSNSHHENPAAVGVFWAIQPPQSATILIDHRCPLDVAEPYGDMLTCPHGHYDLWEGWRENAGEIPAAARALVTTSEYEDWPRGRMVFDTVSKRFTCYADAKILRRPGLLAVIYSTFGLTAAGTETKWDSHYRSTMLLGS